MPQALRVYISVVESYISRVKGITTISPLQGLGPSRLQRDGGGSLLWRKGCLMGKTSKIYIQKSTLLGLLKNRQTPKTFNKGKKIVWRKKEYPSSSSGGTLFPLKAAAFFLRHRLHIMSNAAGCVLAGLSLTFPFSPVATVIVRSRDSV
jgi:hypothetical protein